MSFPTRRKRMEYDNTNRGVLFSERDKKTKDDDRDYSDSLNAEGRELWLSASIKTSKKGTKFLSLSVKPKQKSKATGGGGPVKYGDGDSAIPFEATVTHEME